MGMMEGAINGFDNTNVMLWKLGPEDKSDGQYLAVTDYPYVHEIDPDTFSVKAKYGLSMMEGISMSSSAHWRREVNKDSSPQFHLINLHDGSVIDGFQTDDPALVFST